MTKFAIVLSRLRERMGSVVKGDGEKRVCEIICPHGPSFPSLRYRPFLARDIREEKAPPLDQLEGNS
jgi:hypothetical protein